MAKHPRGDVPIDAAAAYEAAMPLTRFRYRELHQRLVRKPSESEDPHWYFGPLADGRMRVIGYQAPRRLDDAPILLPVELVARAIAPKLHKIDGPALLSLLRPRPSAGRRPEWYVESPTRQAEREAQERERWKQVIPPKAIDWRCGHVAIDEMAFTDCRVILAADLANFSAAKRPNRHKDKIPHGKLGRMVWDACKSLWADQARDWLAHDVTLPMIADELIRRNKLFAAANRGAFEKNIGQARQEARSKPGNLS